MDETFVATAVRLAIVEVLDRDGHARATLPVWRWPVTIGRAVDCDVVLDDEHSAAQHARIAELDGALRLDVGDTVNGVRVGRRHVRAHENSELSSGEVFQIGATRLRVRRLSDALPPERPLAPEPSPARIPVAALVPVFLAWNVGEHWLNVDPGQRLTEYLPPLLGPPLIIAVWAGYGPACGRSGPS
jgi:pSer/pThr/pTyr-binding forkhead associated (FHA) protein